MTGEAQIREEIVELRRKLYELERKLGASVDTESVPDGDVRVLVVRVGDARMGFLLEGLDVVVPMAALTPLPEAPQWVVGLLNLRGEMIPILDVLGRVERLARAPLVSDFIIVCSTEGRRIGLVVQEVEQLLEVGRDQIEPPPRDVPIAPYVLRAVRGAGAPLLLLSIRRLASLSDIPEKV